MFWGKVKRGQKIYRIYFLRINRCVSKFATVRRLEYDKTEVTETSADGDKDERVVKGLAAVVRMKLTIPRVEDVVNMRIDDVRCRWIIVNVV